MDGKRRRHADVARPAKRVPVDWQQLPQDMLVEVLQHLPHDKAGGRRSALCVCRRWCEAGLRAFDPSANHNRALTNAVRANRLEQVRWLLDDRRVDPNQWAVHALSIACGFGRADIVEAMLAHPRVDPCRCDITACLVKAARCRHRDARILSLLLDDRRLVVDEGTADGVLPKLLAQACDAGAMGVVKRLLDDARLTPDASVDLSDFRWNPRNIAAVALVLERGRDAPDAWVKGMISQWLRMWRQEVLDHQYRWRAQLREYMATVAKLLCARIKTLDFGPPSDARLHEVLQKANRLDYRYGVGHPMLLGAEHAWMRAFCAGAGRRPPPPEQEEEEEDSSDYTDDDSGR